MLASLSRCLCLVALAACTMPTEVIIQPQPAASSSVTNTGDGGADPGGVCTPASAAGWSPAWVPPSGASQGACTAADLASLYAACFGATASSDTCSSYQSSSPTCASCVLSASTDATWGPVVLFDDTTTINQPGCLALVDPAAGACAVSAQAQAECEHALCDSNCPVSDSTSLNAWQQCTAQADAGACAAYDSTCLSAEDAGGSACGGADFATTFTNVATVFCGSPN